MNRQGLRLVLLVSLLASVGALAHPRVETCGGFEANKDEGLLDRKAIPRQVESQIEQFLRSADGTPGAAVAIVKGRNIVYARGFGYRELSTCSKTTSKTRFYLKSTTKTLLGIAAASLHEQGAIELDAPISEYLPELQLPDGLSPDQVSLRSHLIHTQPYFDAGLNYRTAFPGNLPESEFVAHTNEFSVAGDIRFRYSNFGPIIAAHAISARTGTGWRDLIARHVFVPAGMEYSFTRLATAELGPMAISYLGGETDTFRPTLTKTDSQMHAAGGAVSTVQDLGLLLIALMNGGRIGDEQALPKRAIEQVQARQVQLSADFSEYSRFAYGLGLYFADYEGDLLIHHFGGETHFSFMPERDIGVVVLANEPSFGSRVTHALASTVYDMLLGKPKIDSRIERRLQEIDAAKAQFQRRWSQYVDRLRKKAPNGESMFGNDGIVGNYVDRRLGEIRIVPGPETPSVQFGALAGPLTPIRGDSYLADFGLWGAPPELFVFRPGDGGDILLDWGGRIFTKQ